MNQKFYVNDMIAGLTQKPDTPVEKRAEFADMGPLDMARHCLELNGARPSGNSLAILNQAMMTSSDYQEVLRGGVNRLIEELHPDAPANYKEVAGIGSLSDFKPGSTTRLTGAGLYAEFGPGGEIPAQPPIEEGAELAQLRSYGAHMPLSFDVWLNDNKQALRDNAAWHTRTAARTINRLVFAKFLENPTLSDGTELFHADRGNALTAALDATALGSGTKGLREMGDENGSYGQAPAVLAVPPALEQSAAVLIKNIAKAGQDRLRLVVEPLMADTSLGGSDTNWLLLPDPQIAPVLRVLALQGQGLAPRVTEFVRFSDNAVIFKAVLDCGVTIASHRGVFSTGVA